VSEKKRAERNIKVNVTDDISHMGITEEEYRILEDNVDQELNKEDVSLTPVEEEFVAKESKQIN
jgi:hypothetical protein